MWDKEPINGDVDLFLAKLDRVARALGKWGNDTYRKIPKKTKALQ